MHLDHVDLLMHRGLHLELSVTAEGLQRLSQKSQLAQLQGQLIRFASACAVS